MVFCHKISFVGVNLCKVLLLSEIFLRLNSLVLPSRQVLSKSDLARDFVTGYRRCAFCCLPGRTVSARQDT